MKNLKDYDPQVVINSIIALEEVNVDQGGVDVNSEIVISLLNRIRVK
jgi:hypothetical protein